MLNTHSISFRLAITIASILVLLAVIAAIYFPYRQQVRMTESFESETGILCDAAAQTIGVGLSNDDMTSIGAIAAWLKSYALLEYIVIVDEQQNVIAAFPDTIALDTKFAGSISRTNNGTSVVRRAPVMVNGVPYGQIILSRSMDGVKQSVRESRRTALVLTLVVILLSIPVAYTIGATIIRPLRTLSDATANVARGDYRPIQHINSKDEVGVLAEHFNAMILQISKQTSELVKSNEQLVNEIAQREQAEQHIKKSLQEKEILLKEIHHRVKNNLQVITSLLNLQSQRVEDTETLTMFNQSQNRVKAMALIHEQLYQTKELSSIDVHKYVTKLTNRLKQSFDKVSPKVNTLVEIDKIFLPLDRAVPCGLIINELVSNCLKYAFPEGKEGHITIKLIQRENKKEYILSVVDNGIGIPANFNIRNTSSLGMQLVQTLTSQMSGRLEVFSDNGTTFRITFPASFRTKGGSAEQDTQKLPPPEAKIPSRII